MNEDKISKLQEHIGKALTHTRAYYEFFQNVQEIACSSSNLSLVNMNELLIDQIKNSTYTKLVSNLIITHNDLNKTNESVSPNSYIYKSQNIWEKKLNKNINSLSTDLNIPLSKKRGIVEGQELKRLWNELGTNVSDLKKYRPVFTINEFLEHILSIKCNNFTDLALQSITGLLSIPIKIKSLPELKEQYKNLSIDYFQSGLDENLNSIIEIERHKNGLKVVELNDAILSREFSKQGCTKSLRGKLWSQILNVNIDNYDKIYYNYLKQCVLDYDLLLDSVYYKDVKTTAVNDDQVFVFEDLLYQVLLIFSRDTHVLKYLEKNSIIIPKGLLKSKNGDEKHIQVNYPPNGYLPFDGFSMLVAPICFVYSDPVLLYYMFRKFFTTHFYKLSTISTDPQCIIGLCVLFENILQSKDPKLFYHMKKIDVHPLKIAFKWIMRAFSGYLLSSQLLELWDRVLAYNSLEILSIFSAGIFLYRKQNLISVMNKSNVESILEDLTSIKVAAILQLFFV